MSLDQAILLIFLNILLSTLAVMLLNFAETNAQIDWKTVGKGYFTKEIGKEANKKTMRKLANGYPLFTTSFARWFIVDPTDQKEIDIEVINVNPPPPGTLIEIYKNGRADFRLRVIP